MQGPDGSGWTLVDQCSFCLRRPLSFCCYSFHVLSVAHHMITTWLCNLMFLGSMCPLHPQGSIMPVVFLFFAILVIRWGCSSLPCHPMSNIGTVQVPSHPVGLLWGLELQCSEAHPLLHWSVEEQVLVSAHCCLQSWQWLLWGLT